MSFLKQFALIVASAIVYLLLSAVVVYAEDACSLTLVNSWANKFPFDIVVGSTSSTNYFNSCPEFVIFDQSFRACSVRTVAQLAKNIFVIRVAIGALMNL